MTLFLAACRLLWIPETLKAITLHFTLCVHQIFHMHTLSRVVSDMGNREYWFITYVTWALVRRHEDNMTDLTLKGIIKDKTIMFDACIPHWCLTRHGSIVKVSVLGRLIIFFWFSYQLRIQNFYICFFNEFLFPLVAVSATGIWKFDVIWLCSIRSSWTWMKNYFPCITLRF